MPPPQQISRDQLLAQDSQDALTPLRELFVLPEQRIYLNGNSLGLLPRSARTRLQQVVDEQWARDGVGAWNIADWIHLPQRVAARIAPLIGAQARETVVADSTSVNLYKLLHLALTLRPERPLILSEQGNFPSDLYIAGGVAGASAQHELLALPPERILEALDERVAVLMLSHINYRSGAMWPIAEITERAQAVGALVLWDVAHSAGAVPLQLSADQVDLAVGCGYKFLNGGPGAPSFAYVNARHHAQLCNPIQGWFGHRQPFAFADDCAAAQDINSLQVGTPAILSLAALDAALDVFDQVEITALAEKAEQMAALAQALVAEHLLALEFECITPAQPGAHGNQLSLRHAQAWAMVSALRAEGVVCDFRAPNVLRFGITPLYTRRVELFDALMLLGDIARTRRWDRDEYRTLQEVT